MAKLNAIRCACVPIVKLVKLIKCGKKKLPMAGRETLRKPLGLSQPWGADAHSSRILRVPYDMPDVPFSE